MTTMPNKKIVASICHTNLNIYSYLTKLDYDSNFFILWATSESDSETSNPLKTD